MSSVDILADVLISRFNNVTIREDYGWPQNSALSVIAFCRLIEDMMDLFSRA